MLSIFKRFALVTLLCGLMAAAPVVRAADQGLSRDVDLLSGFKTDVFWTQGTGAAETSLQCEGPPMQEATAKDFAPPVWAAAKGKRPAIAIVIDDVGLDTKRSLRTLELPAAVTLAFLPYSPHVAAQTRAAAAKGHELMVHLPMEPMGMRANPGPNYLGVNHTAAELEKRIAVNLDAFSGYAGVNNHMGSAFTSYAPGMKVFMHALKTRNVFFLDSKTAPQSVAEDAANEAGINTTHRDVFLDHYEDRAHVLASLEQVERVARKAGSAVAIGHPKDVTLDALMHWLPTLEEKGFDLIPMSAMIARRQKRDAPYTAAKAMPDVEMTSMHHAVSEETEASTAAAEKSHTAATTSKILPSHRKYNR